MPQTDESRWFSEQVSQHEPALRAYLLRRFPSLPDHDDMIQETYARTVRAWKMGRLTHVRGFLFTAARNIAIDFIVVAGGMSASRMNACFRCSTRRRRCRRRSTSTNVSSC